MDKDVYVVTGGTGCIGSFLVEILLGSGATVRVPYRESHGYLGHIADQIEWMQGDLSDPAFCASLLDGATHLFHLAAFRANIDVHKEKREEVFTKNVVMTQSLIAGCTGDIHVMFFSSALVGTESNAADSEDGYIAAKAVCEQLWSNATDDLLLLRPVNVFGPRDRFNKDANVIPALLVRASQEKEVLSVWGSGKQERAFLFAPDLAQVAALFHAQHITGTHYVLPPDVMAIGDLAKEIVAIVNPTLAVTFDVSHEEGVRTMPEFPRHPILKDMQWTPLKEGLRETFEWWNNTLYS